MSNTYKSSGNTLAEKARKWVRERPYDQVFSTTDVKMAVGAKNTDQIGWVLNTMVKEKELHQVMEFKRPKHYKRELDRQEKAFRGFCY